MRRPIRLGLALSVCALAVACSGDSSGVAMVGLEFQPKTFRATAGEPITFDNKSDESHTVTALEDELPEGTEYFASGGFSSEDEARADIAGGLINPGESFELTLDQPGTYQFVCLPHESSGMSGTIIVE